MSAQRCQGSWMPTAMGIESGWCHTCARQVQTSGNVDGAHRLMPHDTFGTVISEAMPGVGGDVTLVTLPIGTMLYGFCGGEFGRDSYQDKRVEAVGVDWVVVRTEHGDLDFTSGPDIHRILAKFTSPEPEGS